jgi:hypothetical protein
VQHPGAIGADLDAGADFGQLRGLLVDGDVDAPAQQRQRGGQTADSAADNGNWL